MKSSETHSLAEDLEMYKEESIRLKEYLNTVTKENEMLKKEQDKVDNEKVTGEAP